MKLIIVRHGQTEENARRLMQGQRGGQLNLVGKEQAQRVARRLKDEKIDIAFVSDLRRAVETAQEILAYHPETPVTYSPDLRERSYGIFEGSTVESHIHAREQSGLSFHEYRPAGGESFQEVQQRIARFYHQLCTAHPEDTTLVVSHGNTIAALLLHLLKKPPTVEEFRAHHPQNTALTIIECDGADVRQVHTLNCTAHLEGQENGFVTGLGTPTTTTASSINKYHPSR